MKNLLIILALLMSIKIQALAQSDSVKKSDCIIIAVSPYVAPYVIQKNDSGIQLEIIKAAFKNQGIKNLTVEYMSNKRAEYQLNNGAVDVAMNHSNFYLPGIYLSKRVLSYQNVVVSLLKNNYTINSVYDLSGKSVLAFQHAPAYLPHSFKLALYKVGSYEEVINQSAQVDHLMKEWVDTIILDKRIFLYYLNEYRQTNKTSHVAIHSIFPEAPRPAYFNSKVLQEIFDEGLANIIKNGQYHSILVNLEAQYAQNPEISN